MASSPGLLFIENFMLIIFSAVLRLQLEVQLCGSSQSPLPLTNTRNG